MIFEILYGSLKKNELILIDGGYCRYHLRKDGHLTIYEILSSVPGNGSGMLEMLKLKKAKSILAKCPKNLDANFWYKRKGFILEQETEKLNHWRLKT